MFQPARKETTDNPDKVSTGAVPADAFADHLFGVDSDAVGGGYSGPSTAFGRTLVRACGSASIQAVAAVPVVVCL